jgi:hypothetical protein
MRYFLKIYAIFFFSEKDIDCDIRENIINYEDEGGGEGDQVGILRCLAIKSFAKKLAKNVTQLLDC